MPKTATEILWDTWGVPHVYAPDDAEAFRAFGWAQMHAHGNLVLKLYGVARGRGAEHWGERYLASDRLMHRVGIPDRARDWAETQDDATRANLEAFVAGLNAYAQQHPHDIGDDVRVVLPVTLDDVFAHIGRVYFVYLTLGGQRPMGEPFNDILPNSTLLPDAPAMGTGIAGSNAWAVSGARTASGAPILLANPHLYWGDSHTFFEAHLNTPGWSLYGVAQVGWPVLRYGFNEHLGWAHTVNTLKGWDAFALDTHGNGYLLDGREHAFDTRFRTLKVREADGTLREETLEIRRTVHGPVVAEQNGRPVAVRCVGLDVAPIKGLFRQYWAMAHATTHAEFERALGQHQNAMFNVMYADSDGNIAQYFTGFVPKRPGGTWSDWAGTLRGHDSALVWRDVHAFDDLPRAVNPPSGWLQNANNPPWLMTLPPVLDANAYPAYVAPRAVTPREQRSIRMIDALERATLDDIIRGANDTRSETADRLLPTLLAVAEASESSAARRGARVLAAWDRQYDAASVGADLFARWLANMQPNRTLSNITAEPWRADAPLDTPRGLLDPAAAVAALERAVQSLLADAGTLERAWGTVTHARRGRHRVPGHGHLDPFGVFRVSGFASGDDGYEIAFGTTYVAAIEFTRPVRARVLLAYGNASQPQSAHVGDQLPLFAAKEMRTAWLTRSDVEANLARHEQV